MTKGNSCVIIYFVIERNKIFEHLDLDGSGEISYDEFLSAMIDTKKVITEDKLERAFKIFDKDGNGRLSVEEIKEVFGGEKKTWKKVIEDVFLAAFFNQEGRKTIKLQLFFKKSCFFVRIFVW